MRIVKFRPRALTDLEGIVTYIAYALNSPKAAADCAKAIFGEIDRVAEFPETGKPFYDESLERSYRRTLVKHYWIYYTYDDESITVWRIFHTSQDHDAYGFERL